MRVQTCHMGEGGGSHQWKAKRLVNSKNKLPLPNKAFLKCFHQHKKGMMPWIVLWIKLYQHSGPGQKRLHILPTHHLELFLYDVPMEQLDYDRHSQGNSTPLV
jgi:hypothetical protein